jgi:hypothetical protein
VSRTSWERLIVSDEEKGEEDARFALYLRTMAEIQAQKEAEERRLRVDAAERRAEFLTQTLESSLNEQMRCIVGTCSHDHRVMVVEYRQLRPASITPVHRMTCPECGLSVEAHVELMAEKAEIRFTHTMPWNRYIQGATCVNTYTSYTINGNISDTTYVT